MCLKDGLVSECFPTLPTFDRLLYNMNAHVLSPRQEVTKGLPAFFTFVCFLYHVVLLVQIKVRLPSEGFSTLCAFIGFLSSVIPDMLFEM